MSQTATNFGAARAIIAVGVLCLGPLNFCAAENPHHDDHHSVFMVEEEWEMVLREPDSKTNSPQVAFFLYPDAVHDHCYFQVQMNYAAEDGYSSGGFRVTAFCNEQPIDDERSDIRQKLSWDGDKITWTNAMAVFDNKLMFALKDGYGQQWGAFGGPEYLVTMDDQDMHALDNYSPQTSFNSVDIGFGKNRVKSIRLKRARLTYTDGSRKTIEMNLFRSLEEDSVPTADPTVSIE